MNAEGMHFQGQWQGLGLMLGIGKESPSFCLLLLHCIGQISHKSISLIAM